MATVTDKIYFTYEDINRLPDGNYEIIDGKRREITPSGFEHGSLEGGLSDKLSRHLKDKG